MRADFIEESRTLLPCVVIFEFVSNSDGSKLIGEVVDSKSVRLSVSNLCVLSCTVVCTKDRFAVKVAARCTAKGIKEHFETHSRRYCYCPFRQKGTSPVNHTLSPACVHRQREEPVRREVVEDDTQFY